MARTSRNEDNKRKILDAAASLIEERGVAGTSLRAICDEAGISTGTLYYHYKAKDDLLADLLRQTASGPQRIAAYALRNDASHDDLVELVIDALRERVTNSRSSTIYLHMLNEALSGNSEIAVIVQEQNDDWIDALETIIGMVRGTSVGIEARTLAILLESLSQGLLIQYALNEDYDDRDEMLSLMLDEVKHLMKAA